MERGAGGGEYRPHSTETMYSTAHGGTYVIPGRSQLLSVPQSRYLLVSHSLTAFASAAVTHLSAYHGIPPDGPRRLFRLFPRVASARVCVRTCARARTRIDFIPSRFGVSERATTGRGIIIYESNDRLALGDARLIPRHVRLVRRESCRPRRRVGHEQARVVTRRLGGGPGEKFG